METQWEIYSLENFSNLFKRLTFDVFPKTRQINSFVHSNVNVEFIKTNSKSFRDLMTYFHGTFWKHLSKGPRPENGDVLEQCVVDIRQCVRIYFQFFFSHSLVKTVDCIKSSNGNESMMFCALAEIFFGLVVAVVVVVPL